MYCSRRAPCKRWTFANWAITKHSHCLSSSMLICNRSISPHISVRSTGGMNLYGFTFLIKPNHQLLYLLLLSPMKKLLKKKLVWWILSISQWRIQQLDRGRRFFTRMYTRHSWHNPCRGVRGIFSRKIVKFKVLNEAFYSIFRPKYGPFVFGTLDGGGGLRGWQPSGSATGNPIVRAVRLGVHWLLLKKKKTLCFVFGVHIRAPP